MKPLPLCLLAAAGSLSSLLAAPPATSLPAPVVPEGLGVNIHFTDPHPGEMEELTAAGFRWVRMDFFWGGIERERGKYDFSAYERLLATLEAHHLRAIFILDYGNPLYEKNSSVVTPEGLAAFSRWAAAAAAHFHGRGILWEIWNEPNGSFWKPKADADQYAVLALAASKAIRQAAPGEAVIGAATSGVDLAFLETCCKAGLLEWWDAVSVHPYRQSAPETAETDYHALRHLITQYAPKGKTIPIISGEWGYSSAWQNFDPARQGKYLPREWLTNLAHQIPVSIWYDWHDDGTDPKEPEHHFGVTEHEYHAGRDPIYDPKPAWTAAKTLTTALAGCSFVRRLSTTDPEDFALLFHKGEELRLAVWTTAATPHEIKLPSSPGACAVLSYLGEERPPLTAADGFLRIPATDAPLYLTARGANPLLAAAPVAHPLRATLLPAPGKVLTARLENLSESAFKGIVTLTHVENLTPVSLQQPVEFADGEFEKTVSFPLQAGASGETRAGLQVESAGQTLLDLPPLRFLPISGALSADCQAVPDGDPKIASEQSATLAAAPEPLPDSDAPVLKISYRLDPGWKFLRIFPRAEAARRIPGEPKAVGLWIYGNGHASQPLSPRLRVNDASHQTWQPGSGAIDWQGWRYVQFDLTPSTAHWGGAKDNVIHYPLQWDSIFLLDNIGRTKIEGAIYIAAPVLIY